MDYFLIDQIFHMKYDEEPYLISITGHFNLNSIIIMISSFLSLDFYYTYHSMRHSLNIKEYGVIDQRNYHNRTCNFINPYE